MKRKLTLLFLVLSIGLFALKNWETYTNTTHIYDAVQYNGKFYFATWGGIIQYDESGELKDEKLTTVNGLSANDIRSLAVNEDTNSLLMATSTSGIDRISGEDFILPISEIIGLPSSKINKVIYEDATIYVASKMGISVFQENPEYPIPVLISNFNVDDGLSSNDITSLELTESGYLFCGSFLGLDYIHIDSLQVESAWHNLNEDNSALLSRNITSISAHQNILAVGTKAGLAVADLTDMSWQIYDQTDFDNEAESVYPVKVDTNNDIWFGLGYWNESDLMVEDSTDIAVCKLDDLGEISFWNKSELGLLNTRINSIKQIGDELYFLTWGEGFFKNNIVTAQWSSKQETAGMCANFIQDLQMDANSRLWLCNGHIGMEYSDKETRGISVFDGNSWKNFTEDNSAIYTNNIYSIAIDDEDKKWFATWGAGIVLFDEENNKWSIRERISSEYPLSSNILSSNTITFVERLSDNTLAASSYPHKIVIFDDEEIIHTFQLHEWDDNYDFSDFLVLKEFDDLYMLGTRYNGLRIWNSTEYPQDGGAAWQVPECLQMRAAEINAITSRVDQFGYNEYWIAASEGLFCYKEKPSFPYDNKYYPAGHYWYRYGQDSKKKQIFLDNRWKDQETPEFWYVTGQPYIYGGANTIPTALYVDPFGLIWIGTADNGFTVYDIENDLFMNYNIENSSLISNRITDFEYDPITGKLYIGTSKGLNSVEIGISSKKNTETTLNDVIVYPNPFYPEKDNVVRIENKNSLTMPLGDTHCKIFDLSGELIITLEKDHYEQFSWNGNNKADKKCSSGVYFYLISAPDGQTRRGKIVLIR